MLVSTSKRVAIASGVPVIGSGAAQVWNLPLVPDVVQLKPSSATTICRIGDP